MKEIISGKFFALYSQIEINDIEFLMLIQNGLQEMKLL